jgi:hypothetical protein
MKLGLLSALALALVGGALAFGCEGAAFTLGSGGDGGSSSTSSSTSTSATSSSTSSSGCPASGCPMTCPSNQTYCAGHGCKDLGNDANHCGTCATACPSGDGCTNGKCTTTCAGMICGGVCVDVNTDAANCGTCGKACGPGASCTSAACGCASSSETYCSATVGCVNEQTDHEHCGSCTKVCGAAQACLAAECTCTGGGSACGTACADLDFDPLHCGSCTTTCASGQACFDKSCVCRPPSSGMPGACSDPGHDVNSCGAGQTKCTGPLTPLCAYQGVGGTCVASSMCAGDVVCNGGCYTAAELQNNPNVCGGCNNVCAGYQVCVEGACKGFGVPAAPQSGCGGSPCLAGTTCCQYPGPTTSGMNWSTDYICVEGTTCPTYSP